MQRDNNKQCVIPYYSGFLMRWTAKTFRAKRKVLKAGSSCSRSCTNTRTTIGHLQACKRFCMCLQKKPDSFIKRSTFFCLCERYMEIRDLHRCGLVGLIASHRFQQRGSFFSQAGKRFRSMCFISSGRNVKRVRRTNSSRLASKVIHPEMDTYLAKILLILARSPRSPVDITVST